MSTVVLAGATGDLGLRIARALVQKQAHVRALVRDLTGTAALSALGVEVVPVSFEDEAALTKAVDGADCVVSALNGLEPVVLGAQGRLLDAAVRAGVPRFVPSDYSLDFTKTRPGRNRNLDLRRRFMERVDAAPIRATSVLSGAFTELLAGPMPLVFPRMRLVLHWGSADQRYDFTAKDDVARFTASVALDADAPRILRIAGDQVSPRELAALLGRMTGTRYFTMRAGGAGLLGVLVWIARTLGSEDEVFPAWQGMQYQRDMVEGDGKLERVQNDRYGRWRWTRAEHVLATMLPGQDQEPAGSLG